MVKVYSSENCRYCRDLKTYLDKKGIVYEIADVNSSEKNARELFEVSGQSGVPVTVAGDNVVVGFDRGKIDAMLERI